MACCLTAPSHYLNQYWLLISDVLWNSPTSNSTASAQLLYYMMILKIMILKLLPHIPGSNELKFVVALYRLAGCCSGTAVKNPEAVDGAWQTGAGSSTRPPGQRQTDHYLASRQGQWWHLSIYLWFPQTLKSAWIWVPPWKVLDFSICLENCKFSLKSAWKLLFMALKNKVSRNLNCLCLFIVDLAQHLIWKKYGILLSNVHQYWSGDPCFENLLKIIEIYTVNIAIWCMASYFGTK